MASFGVALCTSDICSFWFQVTCTRPCETGIMSSMQWNGHRMKLCSVQLVHSSWSSCTTRKVGKNFSNWRDIWTVWWIVLFLRIGRERRILDHQAHLSSFSALLVTASHDTRVLLWSTTTGELLKQYAHKLPVPLRIYAGGDNDSYVRSVAISKGNHFVITTCDDK